MRHSTSRHLRLTTTPCMAGGRGACSMIRHAPGRSQESVGASEGAPGLSKHHARASAGVLRWLGGPRSVCLRFADNLRHASMTICRRRGLGADSQACWAAERCIN
eukprot:310902-Chlamydomonas_euryale.AAC.4